MSIHWNTLGIACYQSFYKKLGISYLEKAIQQLQPISDEMAADYKNLSNACQSFTPCPVEKTLSVSLKAFQLNEKDTALCYIIAVQYDKLKKYDQALHYYAIYLKSLPENSEKLEVTSNIVNARMQQIRKYLKERK